MSAQCKPVDVLTILNAHIAVLRICGTTEGDARMADDLVASHVAIAGLIEAALEVRAAHRELPSADQIEAREAGEARIGRAHYVLEAALAGVHGEAA